MVVEYGLYMNNKCLKTKYLVKYLDLTGMKQVCNLGQ